MRTHIERNIIFLYPELSKLKREEYMQTNQLIADIDRISAAANKEIDRILCSGNFSSVKCKPLVSMEFIEDSVKDFANNNNVRICVAKYGFIDYTTHYKTVINDYKNGSSDISHLVALHISQSERKTNFTKDANGNFDAIIDVDLEHLDILLEAIMLDISLYHYFSLSKDLKDRKEFNELKFSYLTKEHQPSEGLALFGRDFDKDNPIYLPFSYEKVLEYSRRVKPDSRGETINSLIKEYAVFLAESLSENLFYNENGSLACTSNSSHNSVVYDEIMKNPQSKNYTTEGSTFIVIFYNEDSTQQTRLIVIKYDSKDYDFSSWLSALENNNKQYRIFKVCRRS